MKHILWQDRTTTAKVLEIISAPSKPVLPLPKQK
jgi:hypothetical protein